MPPQTATLLARALDPRVPTTVDAMGERILDAALELTAASGLRHLTMDDIAARASLGRMTVYRRFGTRAELIEALAVRECRRCLGVIAAALDPALPIDARIAEGFIATLRVVRDHPLLERLARVEPDAFLSELRRDDSAVFRLVREFLTAWIGAAQDRGELIPGDPVPLADLTLRVCASFVLFPDSVIGQDEDVTRATVRAMVGPLLAP
jgi:AcrR family transcriptional regulator